MFRAAQGAITAPFAVPGQTLQVRVRPACATRARRVSARRPRASTTPSGSRHADLRAGRRSAGERRRAGAGLRQRRRSELAAIPRVAVGAAAGSAGGTATCQADPQLDVASADAGTVQECRLDFVFPAATGPSLSPPEHADRARRGSWSSRSRIRCRRRSSASAARTCSRRSGRSPASTSSTAATGPASRQPATSTRSSRASPRCPSPTISRRWSAPARRRARAALRCALDSGGANAYCPFDWRGVLCQTDASCKFDGFPPPQLVEVAFPELDRLGPRRERTPCASGVSLRRSPAARRA